MKFAALIASVVAVAIVSAPLSAYAAVAAGKPAPALTSKLLDGSTFDLSAKKGRVVIVSFWATWCGPCRQEMPALQAYYARHHGEGLDLLAISMDDSAKDKAVRNIMAAYSFPAAFNRQAMLGAYGRIWQLPTVFVIDRDGVVRFDGSETTGVFDAQKLDKVVGPLLKTGA